MTVSRSGTPLLERRELHESVQELDNLLEDLKKAQLTDEKSYNKRLSQQSQYYSSQSSLNQSQLAGNPGSSAQHHHSRSSASATPPLQKLAAASNSAKDVDYYAQRLKAEINRDPDAISHGVFVKDVVEEEILVDHVLVQPGDRRPITRPSDRRQGERVSQRQVAFRGVDGDRREHSDAEVYENTDTEEQEGSTLNRSTLAAGRRTNNNNQHTTTSSSSYSELSQDTDSSSIVLDASKVVNCHTCGGRVVGQVITALGHNYHKEHFTCAHCGQELGTRNFYEKDDLPYCEKDYQILFSPKCFACSQPILDKVTIALEHTFHPEHFVCAHCGCQFDADDGFHEKDGRPYCKNDFFELFASKCAGCMLPITANYITALNVQWHPDCFVCSDCHCPFGDGKFFDIDGAPYCEIHYHARRGSLCAVCHQPIIGKCTTAMFRKFHPDHFTCTYCLKVLTKSFKEENDKPYCHDCFDKLYS